MVSKMNIIFVKFADMRIKVKAYPLCKAPSEYFKKGAMM